MPTPSGTQRALVVGAGIAGLATALRLRRSGWQVLIVERAPTLRGGGYMVGFSGIGYAAAQHWGLLPALQALQPQPVDLAYLDRNGRERAVLPVAAQQAVVGTDMLALLRGDLESTLHAALTHGRDPAVEIRFTTTVAGISADTDGVTATLDDGTQERVELLIGADGLHSSVRELAFGPESAYRIDFGHAVATLLLDHSPAAVRPHRTESMNLVGRGVGVYHTRGDHPAGFFAFTSTDLDADLAAGPRTTLRRVFGDLGWAVPDLLDQVDTSDSIYFDRISQIAMDRWSSGRIALIGDAAWCVSLYAGYGSSLAVGGADLLGDHLDAHTTNGRTDLPTALARWEHQLRPTVERKQRQGRRARGLFVARHQAILAAQIMLYRLAGSRVVIAALRRFLALDNPPTATSNR